jgi:hypothetical protein
VSNDPALRCSLAESFKWPPVVAALNCANEHFSIAICTLVSASTKGMAHEIAI